MLSIVGNEIVFLARHICNEYFEDSLLPLWEMENNDIYQY